MLAENSRSLGDTLVTLSLPQAAAVEEVSPGALPRQADHEIE